MKYNSYAACAPVHFDLDPTTGDNASKGTRYCMEKGKTIISMHPAASGLLEWAHEENFIACTNLK